MSETDLRSARHWSPRELQVQILLRASILLLGSMLRKADRLTSILKAVSWRVIGTLDTFVIAWIITGSPKLAGGISLCEFATKTVLFYLHERVLHLYTK